MKIAVLADIHANYTALLTVTEHIESWGPDHIIVAGDTINRGPKPKECLDFVLEKANSEGWNIIRGNHEDYVISQAQSKASPGCAAFEVHRPSYWTYQKINYNVTPLEEMQFEYKLIDPGKNEVRIVHASMRGIRDGIYPETTDETLELQIGKPPALFSVGHTHRPLIRSINHTLVVNAGSVGLPFDGDTRPSYAQLTWSGGKWRAKIIRLDYDRQSAERDFYITGYLEEAGPLAELVLIELRYACSQLYRWSHDYQKRALKGKISIRSSVDNHLQNQGFSL